jgi:hypothetical protein
MDRVGVSASASIHNQDNRKGKGKAPTAADSTWAAAPDANAQPWTGKYETADELNARMPAGGSGGGAPQVIHKTKPSARDKARDRWKQIAADPAGAAEAGAGCFGWLQKKGQRLGFGMKKRWFVLENNQLVYKTRRGGAIKGSMGVANCIVTVDRTTGLTGFAVTVPGRTMYCKAASVAEGKRWTDALSGGSFVHPSSRAGGAGGLGGAGGGAAPARAASRAASGGIEWEDGVAQMLAEGVTIIKSKTVSGNIHKYEVMHTNKGVLKFTCDFSGSTNLNLKVRSCRRGVVVWWYQWRGCFEARSRSIVVLIHDCCFCLVPMDLCKWCPPPSTTPLHVHTVSQILHLKLIAPGPFSHVTTLRTNLGWRRVPQMHSFVQIRQANDRGATDRHCCG